MPLAATPPTPDPTGQQPNHYAYAHNDPINNTDPRGDFSWKSVLGTAGKILKGAYGCVSGAVGAERTFGVFATYAGAYVPAGEAITHTVLLGAGCTAGIAGVSLSPTGP